MKGIYKTSINEYTLDEINTNKHKKRRARRASEKKKQKKGWKKRE
ncbi:hypothetical protein [Lachnobacterium bovis]|uniref:Uncharacterized protein n=1 Tax=Lachnobacterium bovis TaxID=140626 RepID=A0A1H9QYG8_9FIRM|nr:hypothetical protein [Lachnobacterium bovis]SER65524.1 hypothetical protein SAMN02910429_00690 [Lachnobacterium bovis]